MKELKHVSAIFTFIVLIIMATGCVSEKNDLVAKVDDISNIQIANGNVNAYLASYQIKANVHNMIIASAENSFYLMVDDESSDWIHVIELKNRKGKLYLKKNQTINACESGKLSPDVVNFVDGQIKGCINCNHKIVKAQ